MQESILRILLYKNYQIRVHCEPSIFSRRRIFFTLFGGGGLEIFRLMRRRGEQVQANRRERGQRFEEGPTTEEGGSLMFCAPKGGAEVGFQKKNT